MALNFPASPSSGDTHNADNGLTYYWDGVKWTTVGTYTTGNVYAQKLDDISSGFNGSTATFTLQVGSSTVKPHNDQSVMIVVNNVVKEPTTTYTINTSGQLTFTGGNIPTNGQSFWGVVYSRLPIDLSTGLSKAGGTMTGDITFASSQTFDATKLTGTNTPSDNSVTSAKIVNGTIEAGDIATGALDGIYYTETELDNGQLNNLYYTETELNNGQLNNLYYTKTQSDANYFNISNGDTIKDGQTFPDNDTTIATTAAINDRIIDLVDNVGGFVPIADETKFPDENPDPKDLAGTIVSIKEIATGWTTSNDGSSTDTSRTISNGNVSNNQTITINGLTANTTYPAGMGMLVETTATEHTYNFHRLTPKATEVTTVAGKAAELAILGTNAVAEDMSLLGTTDCVADMALLGTTDVVADLAILGTADVVADMNTLATNDVVSDMDTCATNASAISNVGGSISSVNNVSSNISSVNNFNDLYQISGSNPGTDGGGNSLAEGDLFFDTSADELKVYNGSSWQSGVTATGNLVSKSGDTMTGSLTLDNEASIRLGEADSNGAHYVGLKAAANLAGNVTWTLPSTDGSADQILSTLGNGSLAWVDAPTGATGGTSGDEIFVENSRTISANYTITATKNAHSVGPITVNNNIVVTIPANSTWLVS